MNPKATISIPSRQSSASQRVIAYGLDGPAIDYAVRLVYRVCCLAGCTGLIDEIGDDKICAAIDRRDAAAMFDWFMSASSFQGVSDEVAHNYVERHGRATWWDIGTKLSRGG